MKVVKKLLIVLFLLPGFNAYSLSCETYLNQVLYDFGLFKKDLKSQFQVWDKIKGYKDIRGKLEEKLLNSKTIYINGPKQKSGRSYYDIKLEGGVKAYFLPYNPKKFTNLISNSENVAGKPSHLVEKFAYELDKLLDFGVVPVTVQRSVQLKPGQEPTQGIIRLKIPISQALLESEMSEVLIKEGGKVNVMDFLLRNARPSKHTAVKFLKNGTALFSQNFLYALSEKSYFAQFFKKNYGLPDIDLKGGWYEKRHGTNKFLEKQAKSGKILYHRFRLSESEFLAIKKIQKEDLDTHFSGYKYPHSYIDLAWDRFNTLLKSMTFITS